MEGSLWMMFRSGKSESVVAAYLSKSWQALLPLPKIAWIDVWGSNPAISEGTTFRMLLSEEPQKLLLILDAFRKWFLCDGGQDFPETVLRMSIVEMLFPGLDGGKGSKN